MTLTSQPTCYMTNNNKPWRFQFIVLESDWWHYDLIGWALETNNIYENALDGAYTFDFERNFDEYWSFYYTIVLGYRHNCSDDGKWRDFVCFQFDVLRYDGYAILTKDCELYNQGSIVENRRKTFKKKFDGWEVKPG
ncbi:unnamed protein product [Caenorhabditis angaria]|uniref:Uncharacterized protein n=1 Tax=Caenorhabditis angaria TaxID=860376 RepID=A0A9P1IQ33_9PELO|nr:unnamed protein product [Caenorhabditis angaria]